MVNTWLLNNFMFLDDAKLSFKYKELLSQMELFSEHQKFSLDFAFGGNAALDCHLSLLAAWAQHLLSPF